VSVQWATHNVTITSNVKFSETFKLRWCHIGNLIVKIGCYLDLFLISFIFLYEEILLISSSDSLFPSIPWFLRPAVSLRTFINGCSSWRRQIGCTWGRVLWLFSCSFPPLKTSRLPDENNRQEVFPLEWPLGGRGELPFLYRFKPQLHSRKHGGLIPQTNFKS